MTKHKTSREEEDGTGSVPSTRTSTSGRRSGGFFLGRGGGGGGLGGGRSRSSSSANVGVVRPAASTMSDTVVSDGDGTATCNDDGAGITRVETRESAVTSYSNDDQITSRGRAAARNRGRDPRGDVSTPRVRRYRGFATSISSLFLDESLVCGALSCFGLILSQRTEHLLNVRNEARGLVSRRGNKAGGERKPSRIVAIALLLTLVGMATTYTIWGFGNATRGGASSYYDFLDDGYLEGYGAEDDAYRYSNQNGDDDGAAAVSATDDYRYHNQNIYWNQNNNDDDNDDDEYRDDNYSDRRILETKQLQVQRHRPPAGLCLLREYHRFLWEPLFDMTKAMAVHYADSEKPMQRNLESAYANNSSGTAAENSGTSTARWIRIGLGTMFLIILGVIGRRRRMRTRYELLRARAQDDHLFYAASISRTASMEDELNEQREDKYEGACSHTIIGFYPIDEVEDCNHDDDDTEPDRRRKERTGQDCLARIFSCISSLCCGCLCNVWIQVFSVCALAQEGREVRLLLPPRLQRVDVLTHQPWSDYYKEIYNLRLRWIDQNRGRKRNSRAIGLMPHFRALSNLSRYILTIFAFCTVVFALVMRFNPRAAFAWGELFLLIATFVQSFLVLFIVHWIFHKSDLSFDAVVKFYATGFVIATPAAFIAEAIMINIFLSITYILYAIGAVIWEDSFLDWISANYKPFWYAGELINAFVVAAMTEEICKYYSFRFIEHPDLIFVTGLDRSEQDSEALYGGERSYSFNSHKISSNFRTGDNFDLDKSVAAGHSQEKDMHRGRRSQFPLNVGLNIIGDKDQEEVRTFRQRAAAVTTAMIGAAVGLACAENFLFVFFFGGVNSGGEEWAILILRSIFPVHALAAAIQSLSVIKKFLEAPGPGGRIGVGKIVFPAVLLHGCFDSILMSVNVYIESSGDAEDGDVPVNAIGSVGICATMIAGTIWYIIENRKQKHRLATLETENRVMELASMGNDGRRTPRRYVNPTIAERSKEGGHGEMV